MSFDKWYLDTIKEAHERYAKEEEKATEVNYADLQEGLEVLRTLDENMEDVVTIDLEQLDTGAVDTCNLGQISAVEFYIDANTRGLFQPDDKMDITISGRNLTITGFFGDALQEIRRISTIPQMYISFKGTGIGTYCENAFIRSVWRGENNYCSLEIELPTV